MVEDTCLQEFVERKPGRNLDHRAENVRGISVDEPFSWLGLERQRSHASDRLGELRQVAAEPIADQEPALFLQHHDGNADDRFALRGNAKDVVHLLRSRGFAIALSERLQADASESAGGVPVLRTS